MKAAPIDVVERPTQLLAGFNLRTAAPDLGPRLENAGHRDALLLVLEVLEMGAKRASSAKSRACAARPNSRPAKLRDAGCEYAARGTDAQTARVGA